MKNFDSLRVAMVNSQLRTTDVVSHAVLSAFLSVPREIFVPIEKRPFAYLDQHIYVTDHRCVMAPSPLAKLLQLAQIKPTDRVLIIGASTGYSAALMASMAASVVALESVESLHLVAKSALSDLKITNVTSVLGALDEGAKSYEPYDVILIEGSVEEIPACLYDQLARDGRLVSVQLDGLVGHAVLCLKTGTGISVTKGFNLSVKALPEFSKPRVFSLFN
jgi:protein-L-isoaspartate(D-aspartate) O-methyltransferase